jgi:hypothetical protein
MEMVFYIDYASLSDSYQVIQSLDDYLDRLPTISWKE